VLRATGADLRREASSALAEERMAPRTGGSLRSYDAARLAEGEPRSAWGAPVLSSAAAPPSGDGSYAGLARVSSAVRSTPLGGSTRALGVWRAFVSGSTA
jgi:hypothetical protein